jgi:archaeosine-15-forming tRNA-guanine transglycosylase
MRSVAIALLLCSFLCAAQKPQTFGAIPHESESAARAFPPELRNELARLRDAALSDDYAYQQLEYLTDSIGARPQGSPQADAAARYVAEQMRKLGLEARLEPVPVRRLLRGAEAAELVEYPGQVQGATQKVVVTALYGTSPTPEAGITADVVVVNDFDELRALGKEKVAGKIVLYNYVFDHRKAETGHSFDAYREAVPYRGNGAKAAAELGALGSLVRSAGDGAYRLAHTGWSADATIPAGAVAAEDAGLIARLAARGKVRLHLTLTSHQAPEGQGYNVIADLKGSEHPEQVVIVSGHLDSWDLATGAIDDGAGVVMAMETAELLHRLALHPKRTIRVIAWMNEEAGATGRDVYAKDYASEIPNHIAAIESDSGAEHPLGFRVKISKAAEEQLSPVQKILTPIGATLLDQVPESPDTDIEPLVEKGVPGFGVWQNGLTYFTYHHTAADTLDKVVPEELRENAACMAVMGYALADMEEPLAK